MHQAAPRFLTHGLFDQLHEFGELEDRIADFESPQDRGDAFEVFAEAYFRTQGVTGAHQVWTLAEVPVSIAKQLCLDTCKDMGVDGVVETNLRKLCAYQVKFRAGRPALTWGELSTFMGLTDQADHRIIFTNCDRLPQVINERAGFHCIRGSDLDRLEPRDFEAIRAWLARTPITRPKKRPLPHQQEALDAIVPALRQHDRVTSIMASATGKTLVSLWVAEQVGAQLVLVLVPSLALLRQTLHEWTAETEWPAVAFLCVCSDRTVQRGMDDWIVRQADVDFPVTTNPEDVRAFLSAPLNRTKLIIATYHSAPLVGEGMPPNLYFDLGVFDEAHRTAGREGTRFSQALQDDGVRIRRRLFTTATPRHYDVRKRDAQGDLKLVYSMDDPDVYGPVVHTLTFAKAARRGIICNYRVVISVVTSAIVNDEVLRQGEVLVDGDVVKARQVANQIALRKATEELCVSKVFTFHRSVDSAKSFTSTGPEGVTTHMPDFAAYHVNGTMLTAKRDRLMREFRRVRRAVMSNARCLIEGVDVPAVDMVAFLSPKRSRIDIVQAVGRAMRKPVDTEKTTGFVLVPLFVEEAKGETVEEAVGRAEFEDVWQLLQAMQEQDDVLAETIREMREQRGHTGGFDDSRFRERVEVLGPDLSIELLRRAVAARTIDRLGATWDEYFGQLKAYKDRFGDCNVPFRWSENVRLSEWVETQRGLGRAGRLFEDRRKKLDEIGFDWRTHGEQFWDGQFEELAVYKERFGNCRVPSHWAENRTLGLWVGQQRRAWKQGKLSDERRKKLLALGFEPGETQEEAFERRFQMLVEFHHSHGHCNVPTGPDQRRESELAHFVAVLRRHRRQGANLTPDRINRLNALGFTWERHEGKWESRFGELKAFNKAHHHCRVPVRYSANPELGKWLEQQKRLYKQNRLSPERQRRLDELGVEWPQDVEQYWWRKLDALNAFVKRHGSYDCSTLAAEDNYLSAWATAQRRRLSAGRLSPEQARELTKLGIAPMPSKDELWEQGYRLLCAFREKHGHCSPPMTVPQGEDRTLIEYLKRVRRSYKDGTLSKDQIQRLEGIGFDWNPFAAKWNRRYEQLTAFQQTHGHCEVPRGWPEDPKLAVWVTTQRNRHKQGRLSPERQRRLKVLGVDWL